jgi:protocatechuate 3,4-dioxygenase beta subunit
MSAVPPHMTEDNDPGSTRRGLLRGMGATGLGLAGTGLLGTVLGEDAGDAVAATPACTLTAEQEEGPFYVALERMRKNITQGRAGLRMDLKIQVVNSQTCKPLKNVAVDIWHCDAGGKYSDEASEGTSGKTYLRGVQLTNSSGLAVFRTIYPGWYEGRDTHVHLKAHVGGKVSGTHYRGGHVAHTGQLFFSDSISDKVAKLSPYSGRTLTRTRLSTDRVYNGQDGAQAHLTRRSKSNFKKGLVAQITVGIDPTDTPSAA